MKQLIRIATSLSVFPAMYLFAGFTMADFNAWNWTVEARMFIAVFGSLFAVAAYTYPGWWMR